MAQGEASRLQEIQAAKAAQAMELQGRAAQRQEEESALNAKTKLQELNEKIRALAMSRLSAVPEGDQEAYLKTIGEFKDIFPSEYDVLSKRKWDADTRRMVLLTPEQQYQQETKDVTLPSGETQTMRYPKFGGGGAAPINALRSAAKLEPIEDANKNILGYRVAGTGITKTPEEAAQYDYTMAREGTGKNPRSSAQGIGQFIDSTFVDTYRKTFPDRARGMSTQQILAQRGTMIDGAPVEQPMLQAFTAANQQRLRDAGFQPSKGNTYLAHFAGPEGAIDVLSAAPDTPVSELLSPKAIKANPEVFAKVKTAGDLIRWAGGAGGGTAKTEGLREPLQSYRPAPIGTEDYTAQKSALKFLDAIEYDPETGNSRPAQLLESVKGGRPAQVMYGLARAFGVSTAGTRAESRLSAGQKQALLAKVGDNMGGRSFTDEDRRFVMEAIGGLDDTAVPVGDRLSRFDEAIRMFANRAAVPYKAAPQLERLSSFGGREIQRPAPSRGQAGETPAPLAAPEVGEVRKGYKFKGGNPASPSSWEKQ
jgi:hypothetical protein